MTDHTEDRIRLAEERYWPKVDKSGDCWMWKAGKTKDGYGQFYFDGKTRRATHFALIVEGSDVPSGMVICHTCDNPSCVNPDHLWLGTIADNNRDRERKGRSHRQAPSFMRDMQRVMARKRRRLTDWEVRSIRSSDKPGCELAVLYDVSPQAISDIRTRKTYVDVE